MAELLIHQYLTPDFVDKLDDALSKVYADWNGPHFKGLVYDKEWDDRALKQRMSHLAVCLQRCLPKDYLEALQILKRVCVHFSGLNGMVFSDFVEQFGKDHLEESLSALEVFTQYGSAEFAIRPFIVAHEKMVMTKMLEWSVHENFHVRRLSSEGCRPRLPWAMALPRFKQDPALILPILENLKDDPEEYVRKSVANNLNDLTKDNPDRVLALLRQWNQRPSKRASWIIKHGLRSLVKSGDQRALKLLGFKRAKIALLNLRIQTPRVVFGEELVFSFDLRNDGQQEAAVVVDYEIHFMKANGNSAPKVFKIKNMRLNKGETVSVEKTHSIRPITTRKYYPGKHKVGIQVNGKVLGVEEFELVMEG